MENTYYSSLCYWVVVSDIFHVHPYLGKIPILIVFLLGRNHQLAKQLFIVLDSETAHENPDVS